MLEEVCIKSDWLPDELVQSFTLSNQELSLLGNKAGATRLSFAVLLKTFQMKGYFVDSGNDLPRVVVVFLAQQCFVSPSLFDSIEWDGRMAREHRTQIRLYLGVKAFRIADEAILVAWLEKQVIDFDVTSESLKHLALGHLRINKKEFPSFERLERLVREAVKKREALFVSETAVQLSLTTRASLDALVTTGTDIDEL
jgi:hypothetical protein